MGRFLAFSGWMMGVCLFAVVSGAQLPSAALSPSALSPEERAILARGEINPAQHVIGGILGTWPFGLGMGHAVQGRYLEKGWIFTVGELASAGVFVVGIASCMGDTLLEWKKDCSNDLWALGIVGFLGFRVWEIIDVWVTPFEINRRYRGLRGQMQTDVSFHPLLFPMLDPKTSQVDGAGFAVGMSF